MRIPTLVGIALIGLGGFLVFGGGSFASRRAARTAGGVPFFIPERHPVKPWIAAGALVVGIGLLYRKRRPGSRGSQPGDEL